ncbi:MFS transporter [Lentzea sp. NBRC 102530]|nr:MFS transporter [Lentzea sp. NBRC 102530]
MVLAAVFFSFSLPQALVNPVLPQLQAELQISQGLAAWVVTAYLLSATVSTPVLGRLGDLHGRDRVLTATLVVLAVGSLVAAVAPGIGTMIVGRVLQGAGSGVLPLAFAIVRDETPPAKLAGAIGATAAMSAAGGGVGLVLAGPLVDLLGIRSLFWIPLVMTVLVAVAAKFVIPPSRTREPGAISWPATVLLAGWLTAALLPLAQAGRWPTSVTVGLLAASVVLMAGWVKVERLSPSPLVDLRLMRVPAVWVSNAISMLMGFALFAVFGFLPVFLQTSPAVGYGFAATVTEAGLLLVPMTVMMFLAGLVAARLTTRYGARLMFVSSSALNVVALLVLALLHDHRWQVLLAMGLLGTAMGTAFTVMSTVIATSVPAGRTGLANGVNANVRTLGGALGAALVGSIITSHTTTGGAPAEVGYTYGFLALAAAGLVAVAVAFATPRRATPGGVHGSPVETGFRATARAGTKDVLIEQRRSAQD